jgi:hypothetical protein
MGDEIVNQHYEVCVCVCVFFLGCCSDVAVPAMRGCVLRFLLQSAQKTVTFQASHCGGFELANP